MARLEFTTQLAQHVDCPSTRSVDATHLGEAFEIMFAEHPALRDYVLDDRGAIRQHIAVFIDGEMLEHRDQLNVAIAPDSEVFVMQAVAGG